ncbi:hypothetical protein D3C76_1199210 [compost metagenome]
MASGALRLTGNPNAINTGNNPRAINHCARPHARQGLQAPSRPLNVKSSTATAANDSQNPGSRLANGSHSNTALSASNNGKPTPRWR